MRQPRKEGEEDERADEAYEERGDPGSASSSLPRRVRIGALLLLDHEQLTP
jgi:hypothetical protein